VEDDVVYASPTSFLERQELTHTCVVDLGIQFPALVDDIDNRIDEAYAAWPERLYLIGKDGRVIFKSGPGPFGFDPEELAAALEKLPVESTR
jgi:type I thyroxine 5'-deiodinase